MRNLDGVLQIKVKQHLKLTSFQIPEAFALEVNNGTAPGTQNKCQEMNGFLQKCRKTV